MDSLIYASKPERTLEFTNIHRSHGCSSCLVKQRVLMRSRGRGSHISPIVRIYPYANMRLWSLRSHVRSGVSEMNFEPGQQLIQSRENMVSVLEAIRTDGHVFPDNCFSGQVNKIEKTRTFHTCSQVVRNL